jgi:hypothetical protein
MKKNIQKISTAAKSLLICLLIVAGCISDAAAVSTSSKGKDFWLMFDGNLGTPTLTLFITSSVNTSGSVSASGMTTVNYTVTANTVTQVNIPNTFSTHTNGAVDNKGIHVTALADVTVYGLNYIPATTDAYLGLPTDVLGTDYMVMTYKNSNIVNGNTLGIVATVNGTTVTITPSQAVGAHPANVPFTVAMNQGQTYELVQTSGTGDLTGTVVTSTQPIGLMGASQCANIPGGATYCDHIDDMIPPTTTWGKKFGAVPMAQRVNGDTWRFMASTNGTTIKINGVAQTPVLNKGQFLEKIITSNSFVEADQPILAAQFANGSSFSGEPGDPLMMIIPPLEQFVADYTVINVTGYTSQYLNIIAPAAIVGSVNLDGTNIGAANFSAIGASGYSAAKISVSTGQHHLSSSQPFGVFVYGFNQDDSYGYGGGQSFAPVATVTTVAISPTTGSGMINTQNCWDATVTDQFNHPVAGVVVHFDITGANPGATGFATTDANGIAHFCYSGANAGNDHIVASVGALSSAADFTWTSCSITVSNCPQDITVYTGAANASCSQTASWTPPGYSSNCTVSTSSNYQPGDVFPVGNTQVTYTFNATGASATCSFMVHVIDNTPPVPTVAALAVVTGECSATATAPTATDNCTAATITGTTGDPLTYNDQGTYTIHWLYTDANNNTTTQNQTVIVRDVTPPAISGTPANINVNNDAGQCGAIVSWTAPTTSDNCSSTITQTAGLASGSQFPVGTTTITYTATDAGGNTVTSSFDVAVTDNENPTITAPSNVTINGWCTNTTADLGTPVTGDNCGVASVTNNAPATFPVGTTTVTWTVTDVHGHTATANQTVTVNPATVTGSFNTEPDRITAACPGGYILWGYDTNISVSVSGGTAPYSYNWTAGATGSTATGTFGTTGNPPAAFTVVVTDAHACSVTLTKTTCITDVRCGNNVNMDHKVTICHKAGNKWNTICVDQDAVPAHLAHGDMVGPCTLARHGNVVSEDEFQVFPNPNGGSFTITLVENADSKVVVTDMFGKVVFTKVYSAGTPTIYVSMPKVAAGMYFLNVQNGDSSFKTKISVE